MLPSICAPSTVLLLVFLVGVASSTEVGGSNQMLQPASLLELTVEESGLSRREAINMNLFMWLHNMTANVTYLTICTNESLIQKYENITAGPILLFYQPVGAGETNIEGQVLKKNSSCSLFTMNGTVPLARDNTTYKLDLIVTNGNSTIYRSGDISFGMPVVTSILSCRNESYTRAAELPSDITFDFPSTCINDTQRSSDDVVCYLEGQFSDSYLCYTTDDPSGLQVCLQGSSLNTINEVEGLLTISYLAYERVPDTPGAHISLEYEGQEPTYGMESIILKDNRLLATICLNTSCSIPDFTPGFVHYDVCAVILVDGLVNKTSTDTITDLDAVAFSYSGSPLLQFGYTNANPERYYSANVVNVAIDSTWAVVDNATVDCSGVPLNTTCHGYFEAACGGDLMVAVEYYSDPEINNKGNKIIFPCQSITETRR